MFKMVVKFCPSSGPIRYLCVYLFLVQFSRVSCVCVKYEKSAKLLNKSSAFVCVLPWRWEYTHESNNKDSKFTNGQFTQDKGDFLKKILDVFANFRPWHEKNSNTHSHPKNTKIQTLHDSADEEAPRTQAGIAFHSCLCVWVCVCVRERVVWVR